jgi:hypothetical protein
MAFFSSVISAAPTMPPSSALDPPIIAIIRNRMLMCTSNGVGLTKRPRWA